jgi:hypothetical protein
MNTHGQAVDTKGRIHAVVRHCTEETLAAAGSRPGEELWGAEEARRYHHYWREKDGTWQHRELSWVPGSRPKVFIDGRDNLFLIYQKKGYMEIASATAGSGYTDWKVVHTEPGPFLNEMLGDPILWKQSGILSVMAQQTPENPGEPTTLRIMDFTIKY